MIKKGKKKKPESSTYTLPASSQLDVLPDGSVLHTIKTLYATLTYSYLPKTMEAVLRGVFTELLGRLYFGKPIDLHGLIEISEEGQLYPSVFTAFPELSADKERYSQYAFDLLQRQVQQILIEISEQIIQEVLFRTLRELKGQDLYVTKPDMTKLLDVLLGDIEKRIKQRINARRPGEKERGSYWTPERSQKLLLTYEKTLQTFKSAKRIYKQNKDTKEWKDKVRNMHPEISKFIDKLPDSLTSAQDLTYEYLVELYKVSTPNYMKKILTEARKQRK